MSLATKIQQAWQQCQQANDIEKFNQLITQLTPYSGTVNPKVIQLEPGFCQLSIEETHALHNPFNSVHAVALINAAELASGLAILAGLPENTRCIISELSAKYYKKARGKLIAQCRCDIPDNNQEQQIILNSKITNQDDEVVAQIFATWQLGPEKR